VAFLSGSASLAMGWPLGPNGPVLWDAAGGPAPEKETSAIEELEQRLQQVEATACQPGNGSNPG